MKAVLILHVGQHPSLNEIQTELMLTARICMIEDCISCPLMRTHIPLVNLSTLLGNAPTGDQSLIEK